MQSPRSVQSPPSVQESPNGVSDAGHSNKRRKIDDTPAPQPSTPTSTALDLFPCNVRLVLIPPSRSPCALKCCKLTRRMSILQHSTVDDAALDWGRFSGRRPARYRPPAGNAMRCARHCSMRLKVPHLGGSFKLTSPVGGTVEV